MIIERFFSFIGIFVFITILYVYSENKKRINWKLVLSGLFLQFFLALLILGVPFLGIRGLGSNFFIYVNNAFLKILDFSFEGSQFIFGPLVEQAPFAFSILPTIVFFSCLMALLYHIKILSYVVYMFSYVFSKLSKISGAESVSVSANIFLGQTESPLIIKPFLRNMTRSETLCLMVGGMATVAGGVMALYVLMLKDFIPNIGGHLFTASLLSAPAAYVCSKILIPETDTPETLGHVPKTFFKSPYDNAIDACTQGTIDGLKLAVNVGAMLIAFISLVALFDYMAGEISLFFGFDRWGEILVHESLYTDGKAKLNLSVLFSWIFYPFGLLLGVSFEDSFLASAILSKKLFLNELIAYADLKNYHHLLSERSKIILSYALCGFANFSSIGIQVGGIGTLEPNKKKLLSELGFKALLGGTVSAYLTACIAGLLI